MVRVEVLAEDRARLDAALLDAVFATMKAIEPTLSRILLDSGDYRPGRAFTLTPTSTHFEPSPA